MYNRSESSRTNRLIPHPPSKFITKGVSKQLADALVVNADTDIAEIIDVGDHQSVHIFGKVTGNHPFYIIGSNDKQNYFMLKEVFPESYISAYHFSENIEKKCRYIVISNSNTQNTFTINYQTYSV